MTTTNDERLSDLTSMGGGEGGEKHFFAEIAIVDDYDCVLQTGQGKVSYSPLIHRPEQRRVNVSFMLICTKKDGGTYDLKQDDITSGSKHKLTLASLQELGIETRTQLKALAGQFCQVVKVPTGKKYAAKRDSADGAIKAGDMLPEMALKFLALYPDAAACRAAETAFYTPRNGDTNDKNVPQPVSAQDLVANVPQIARATLLATLPAIVTAAKSGGLDIQIILNGNSAYAQAGITAQSPEVVALLAS